MRRSVRNRRDRVIGSGWGIGYRDETGNVNIVETRQTRDRARRAAKARTEESNGLRYYASYRLAAMPT